MGQPFKWFGPTIDEVGQLQQPSRMVWQAKYKKWKTNSAPAVAPTSTDGSPPRSAALSHKYKSDFTEILKNSIAEIQHIKKQNCQQTAQHATARTLLGIKEITPLGRSGEIFLKS